MKSLSLAIVLVVLDVVCFAQQNVNHLQEQRNGVYQKYVAHSDTMSVNTWVNIMNSKKLLEQIVHFDTLILAASMQNIKQDSAPAQDVLVSQLKQELTILNEQLLLQKQNSVSSETGKSSYKKYLGVLSVSAFLLFVVVIVLAILFIRVNKSLKLSEKEAKKQYTDLQASKYEIEKTIKVENQLASEINNIKQQFNRELDDLKKARDLALEEKLMLDNQIVEVKKAYDLEVSNRMDFENQLKIQSEEQKDNVESVLNTDMITDLQAEIFDLSTVNESLTRGLDMAVEKNMAGDQLLIDELDKLKIKYDIEVKTRKQTEEELQGLLSKLKSHFKS